MLLFEVFVLCVLAYFFQRAACFFAKYLTRTSPSMRT